MICSANWRQFTVINYYAIYQYSSCNTSSLVSPLELWLTLYSRSNCFAFLFTISLHGPSFYGLVLSDNQYYGPSIKKTNIMGQYYHFHITPTQNKNKKNKDKRINLVLHSHTALSNFAKSCICKELYKVQYNHFLNLKITTLRYMFALIEG